VTGPPEWNPGETRATTPAGSFAILPLRNARRPKAGRGPVARAARWLCAGALAVGAAYCAAADPLPLTGFNMAGAEFGTLPGQAGKDYNYPSQSDVTEMLLRGANVFRLPFRWERLQTKLGGPFDAAELDRLTAAVNMITSKGAKVIISPHNYARYQNEVIGSPAVPIADFAAFWRQLAAHFGDNSLVLFGLMNEPHDLPTLQWRDAANAAIAAIRAGGAMNLILAPGNNWTGGQSWNAEQLRLRDPPIHGRRLFRDPWRVPKPGRRGEGPHRGHPMADPNRPQGFFGGVRDVDQSGLPAGHGQYVVLRGG
jgi:hypothetical protein